MSSYDQIDAFAEAVTQAPTAGVVWNSMEQFCQNLDFGSTAYIYARDTSSKPQLLEMGSNLAGPFDQQYHDDGVVGFDPFLLFGCQSFEPRKFGTSFVGDLPFLTKTQVEFLDYAASSGVPSAIGIPVALREGGDFGGWIIGTQSGTPRQFDLLCDEAGDVVRLAAMVAHERMKVLREGQIAWPLQLSGRERECMIWLSLGLRTDQIADKLCVSASAVNLYTLNARRKLGAKTREHAVALAITRGEIAL